VRAEWNNRVWFVSTCLFVRHGGAFDANQVFWFDKTKRTVFLFVSQSSDFLGRFIYLLRHTLCGDFITSGYFVYIAQMRITILQCFAFLPCFAVYSYTLHLASFLFGHV
jgi:hypothetical protein